MTARAFVSLGSNDQKEVMIARALGQLKQKFSELRCSSVYESRAVLAKAEPQKEELQHSPQQQSPQQQSEQQQSPAVANYFNAVVSFATEENARSLRAILREIEHGLGRQRPNNERAKNPCCAENTQRVVIDLDLLLIAPQTQQGDQDGLPLPHPDILRYEHTLRPLAEIAGEVIHPIAQQSLAKLLEQGLSSTDFAKTVIKTIPVNAITEPYEHAFSHQTEPQRSA